MFVLTLRRSWRVKKGSKTFLRVLERQNMQIETIFELHTHDNKSKYSKDILISAKKLRKTHKILKQILNLQVMNTFQMN